jgi:hypothetical protein
MIRFLLAGLLALTLCSSSNAQLFRRGGSCSSCGSGGCASCGSGLTTGCAGGCCTTPGACGMQGCPDCAPVSGMVSIRICDGRTCHIEQIPSVGTAWIDVPNTEQYAKYVNGVWVGSFDAGRGVFRSYSVGTGAWGEETTTIPPDVPARARTNKTTKAPQSWTLSDASGADPFAPTGAGAPAQEVKFGLEWAKVDGAPTYSVGGTPTTKQQMYVALNLTANDSGVPHDGSKPWIGFVCADPAKRAAFAQSWESAAELKPWHDRMRIKALAPTDPMLRDRDGKPLWYASEGIYCVASDGKALGQMTLEDYEGPESLAGALFQIDPQFDPSEVPDLARPQAEDAGASFADYLPVIGAGLVVLFVVFAVCAGSVGVVVYLNGVKQHVPAVFATGMD